MEKINNPGSRLYLGIIILIGAVLRILFWQFGGEIYYGTKDFSVQGDTWSWLEAFLNLWDSGIYTTDLTSSNAKFFRPPGYSYFLGGIYLLTGRDLELTSMVVSIVQIVADCMVIGFIYHITLNISKIKIAAFTAASLYACYPFVIVWTPVLYAECMSIFFISASLALYFTNWRNRYILSGILAGIAVLTRLQCIFFIPFFAWFVFQKSADTNKIKPILFFLLGFSVSYGTWPARNIINHNRFLFSQDLNVGKHWSPDYMAFMDYVFSIKTDHQPQYSQIIHGETVIWPDESYLNTDDSVTLAELSQKCRECGTGFSYFMYYAGIRDTTLSKSENCDDFINSGFKKLINEQKQYNAINYYIKTPLGNLKKALFKFSLYGNKSTIVKIAGSTLFIYRTLLILIGVTAIILNYRRRWFDPSFGTMLLLYFISWYLYLSVVYRNMEIRYLLHVDILLLIPATFLLIGILSEKVKKGKSTFGLNS